MFYIHDPCNIKNRQVFAIYFHNSVLIIVKIKYNLQQSEGMPLVTQVLTRAYFHCDCSELANYCKEDFTFHHFEKLSLHLDESEIETTRFLT